MVQPVNKPTVGTAGQPAAKPATGAPGSAGQPANKPSSQATRGPSSAQDEDDEPEDAQLVTPGPAQTTP